MSRGVDVLIAAAMDWELSDLAHSLDRQVEGGWGRRPWVQGELEGLGVGLLSTGMGKVNMASALAAALEHVEAGLVLVVGVGGAYPESGLEPGDLAIASEERYGDEGVCTDHGFQGLRLTGIPLWEADGIRYFDRFPTDPRAAAALEEAGRAMARVRTGPFVTVSTVTGTQQRGRDLAEWFGGICENMEGAAAAHACAIRSVRFAELRGISNRVGPRDRSFWLLREAAMAAQTAVRGFLSLWQETGLSRKGRKQ